LEEWVVKHACQYTIIQFLPFAESGEFANVGIALVCPDLGYFGFKVNAQWRRMKDFFAPLEQRIFNTAIDRLKDELKRVDAMATALPGGADVEALWHELVRRRDGIIRYATPRAILADDPNETTKALVRRYVEHDFASIEYQERRLERTVREVLTGARLSGEFRRARLGEERFHITLPFVQMDGEHATKVIKPLFLAHDEPTKIIIHGTDWLGRLDRLRRHHALPDDVLIPVASPATQDACWEAFSEIRHDLEVAHFQVKSIDDRREIVTFAQGDARQQ
jgi:hypothetical protein